MADPKDTTEERKPFITFSFDEEGNFDRYAGIYLHIPLEKPPTAEEIAIMVGTIKTYAKCWQLLSRKLELGQKGPETPPDEGEVPAPESPPGPTPAQREAAREGGRPPGGASDAQCRKILAVCHRLDDKIVVKAIEGYAGAEWRLDDDGRCIPNWDFLQSLNKHKASTIIERLERAEA